MKTCSMVVFSFLCLIHIGSAQCDSLYQNMLIDSRFHIFPLINGVYDTTRPLDKRMFVPTHRFEFQNDTTSIRLTVNEYRLNSRWIMLQDWCYNKIWNWSDFSNTDTVEVSDSVLSEKSRTKTIRLLAGDTISVFRWFIIMNDLTNKMSPNFLDQTVVSHTVIELVDATSNTVLMKLDSIQFEGINSKPCIKSIRPAIARVVAIIPSELDSVRAFIRTRVGSNDPNVHWHRVDRIEGATSFRLLQTGASYNAKYEQGNICSSTQTQQPVSISSLSNPSAIRCSTSESQAYVIRIFSTDWLERASFQISQTNQPIDTFLNPGLYFVVVFNQAGSHVFTSNVLLQ